MQYRISRKKVWIIFVSLLIWILLILAAPALHAAPNPLLKKLSHYLYLFFKPTCHQLPSRSFHIQGYALAVCIRCFAFYSAGLIISVYYLFHAHLKLLHVRIYMILCAPLLIDFILEKLNLYSDLYYVRFITGFVAGLVLFHLLVLALSDKIDIN
jgi:uncharacterized membrane protein